MGEKAIINGPNKTITINTGKSSVNFPIVSEENTRNKISKIISKNQSLESLQESIQDFNNIDYITRDDINPNYEKNFRNVKNLTQEISDSKIRINGKPKNLT